MKFRPLLKFVWQHPLCGPASANLQIIYLSGQRRKNLHEIFLDFCTLNENILVKISTLWLFYILKSLDWKQ